MGLRDDVDETMRVVRDIMTESAARDAAIRFLSMSLREAIGEDAYRQMAEQFASRSEDMTVGGEDSISGREFAEKISDHLRFLLIINDDD